MLKATQIVNLTATPIGSTDSKYIDLLNKNIKPPVPLELKRIHIRAMFVVNDSPNSFGGCFDRADLTQITELFIDTPVLIGHDKSALPVARIFWAETVQAGERLWVKCYFFWPREVDYSDRLRINIDSGIYKECSVSFLYDHPECSACGGDFRICGHAGSRETHYYYKGVQKILETSLVYRGAVPGTHLTNQLVEKPERFAVVGSSINTASPAESAAMGSKHINLKINGRRYFAQTAQDSRNHD